MLGLYVPYLTCTKAFIDIKMFYHEIFSCDHRPTFLKKTLALARTIGLQ